MRDVYGQAIRVLAENELDQHATRPGPELYPHQWLWDSCFIAIGMRHSDPERAKNELRGVLRGQWENGMLPHVQFSDMDVDYFPDPYRWNHPGKKATSGITQPPVPAIAAWKIFRSVGDVEFLKEVVDSIAAYHEYLHRERGGKLLHIIHPWESGMDNSPVYDEPLRRVRSRDVDMERLDEQIVSEEHRPGREYYVKCLSLIELFAEESYNMQEVQQRSEFLVEDILFNSIWCEANRCLANIIQEVDGDDTRYRRWHEQTKHAIGSQMRKDGRYYSRDVTTGELIEKETSASFSPLFAGVPSEDGAREMETRIDDFAPPYPVASTHPEAESFDPVNYWRGPVWINVNWMIAEGFDRYALDPADTIRKATLELVQEGGFYEYFNPVSGEPCGTGRFSWTAALTIDLLERKSDELG